MGEGSQENASVPIAAKITRTSLVCWSNPSNDAGRPRAGERFEVGEDQDGDGSFVGAADGGDWLGWLGLRRWSDLTILLAGLRRGDLRRGENQQGC
jgi:hypothetical protein